MLVGPLADVGTIMAAVNFDVSRQLNYAGGVSMIFLSPAAGQPDGWKTEKIILNGWNRLSEDERSSGDSQSVIYQLAAIAENGGLEALFSVKGLHVKVLDEILSVEIVTAPASNEAQIYTLTCKTRIARNTFFTNKR